jgi:cell wall-associated NlpC family hydrolase
MNPLLPAAAAAALLGGAAAAGAPLLVQASLAAASSTQTPPAAAARAEIPAALLPHYQRAPACQGLPWQIVAAIGAVESDHGRHGGAHLDPATGDVSPPIIGPALNGRGYAAVAVPAGGSPWHPDRTWDHAVGPMQFLTATWAVWGVDGSGDGLASPHNAYDAIAAAGRYLCHHRTRIDSIPAAVLRYNPSRGYLTEVLDKAHAYGMTDGGEPAPAGPATVDPAAGGPVVRGDAGPVIAFALAQLGKPYRWGAAGPDAYDCSGLTLAAYATIGIQLPHYAAYQLGYGQPVDWHRQPIHSGDLLFLRGGDPVHDYGHVGIAVDDARWINAPMAAEPVTLAAIPHARLQAVRRLILP